MPGIENHDAGGHVERLLLIVRDVDEGDTQLLLQAFELLLHLLPKLQIQRAQRFVQQKNLGLEHHRARDGNALPLPAGELGGHAPFKTRQPHQRKRRHHSFLLLAFADAQHLQPIGNVLEHVHMGEERIVLKHRVHGAFLGRKPRHVRPVDHDATGRGTLQPRDDAQRGRLSAPAGTQQCQKFARIHVQAQTAEHQPLAVVLAQPIQTQHGFSHRLSLPSFSRRRTAHPAAHAHEARFRG